MDCTMSSLTISNRPCFPFPLWNQAPRDTNLLPIPDFILRWGTG